MNSQQKIIATAFSRSAVRYDKAATVQQKAGRQLLDTVRSKIPLTRNFQVAADIGCGTGYFTQPLIDHFSLQKYIGIDLAQGMLDVAIGNNGETEKIQWLCNDAQALSLRNESVDLIYSNFSLQWCENLPQLMEGFYRVLKPGGLCCFTSLGSQTLYQLREAWQVVDQLQHVNHFYDKTLWQASIQAYNFSVLHRETKPETVYFPSVKEALHSIKAIGANTITGKHRNALMGKTGFQRFISAYETFRTAQGIPVTYDIDYWMIEKPTIL